MWSLNILTQRWLHFLVVLAQVEFETRPGQWQGTSFSVKLNREKDEDKWAEHLGVKFYDTVPSGEAVWLDNFIMR